MAKGRRTVSAKNSFNLIVLAILALVIVIGGFALQQTNGFSLFPHASTLSSGSSSPQSSYMCQERCVANSQCGNGQICGVKPGSGTAQKFCYNPSCPDNQQCGGEGCGECKIIDYHSPSQDKIYMGTLEKCQNECAGLIPGGVCRIFINYINQPPKYPYYCTRNVCRNDFVHVIGDVGSYNNTYLFVHKQQNMCPLQDNGQCPEGFRCDKIIENGEIMGLKITRVGDRNGFSTRIGVNCPCSRDFCERGEFRSGIPTDQIGKYINCRFDTAKCEGPFGP